MRRPMHPPGAPRPAPRTLRALALAALTTAASAHLAAAQGGDESVVGPGPAPVDVFNPDRVAPRYGGRVIVHLESMPANICYPIENSAITRRILYEVHETLLHQDWEYHDYRPRLAKRWTTEDLVVLKDGVGDEPAGVIEAEVLRPGADGAGSERIRKARALYGRVQEVPGAVWVIPVSKGSALPEPVKVPREDVDSIERGAVFTFELRDDVPWHPSLVFERENPAAYERLKGQKLDARDVLFSWSIYRNQAVKCDEKRFQFVKTTRGEIVDEHTVRFFNEGQYAFATAALGDSLAILPSHVYDLSDPDNPDYREHFTEKEQADHINDNPHNRLWVGLGPYRVTRWTDEYIQAERFTDEDGHCLYFDRDNAGYLDTIRWRHVDDDEAAMNAVLNGELDYFERIKSADYFGPRTESPAFTDHYYKGYKYLGLYGVTCWNMYRPQLKELVVRKAIAMGFDFDNWKDTYYQGLCRQVTGPFPYNSGAYDHSVEPLPYDPEGAIEMLEDAGWYDHDGDGIRDKDGVELEIEFLMPTGNDASMKFGLRLQESLAALEMKLDIVQREWATFAEELRSRNFDCANLAWIPSLESDPAQLWFSKYGEPDVEGSNYAGVMDPKLDEMILRGERELDREKRLRIWNEMHRYIYEQIQPYMFLYNVPNKFAMNRKIRGFQAVAIDPGYVIRRWYYTDPGDPVLRDTLDR